MRKKALNEGHIRTKLQNMIISLSEEAVTSIRTSKSLQLCYIDHGKKKNKAK